MHQRSTEYSLLPTRGHLKFCALDLMTLPLLYLSLIIRQNFSRWSVLIHIFQATHLLQETCWRIEQPYFSRYFTNNFNIYVLLRHNWHQNHIHNFLKGEISFLKKEFLEYLSQYNIVQIHKHAMLLHNLNIFFKFKRKRQ